MDSLAPGGQKTCDAAVVVDRLHELQARGGLRPGRQEAEAHALGREGHRFRVRLQAEQVAVPRHSLLDGPHHDRDVMDRADAHGRCSPHARRQRVRDLAERDIGVDARTDAREDVLRASRRRLEGRQRRAGGRCVTPCADLAGARDLARLQLGVDGLGRRPLLVALRGERVEADDHRSPDSIARWAS